MSHEVSVPTSSALSAETTPSPVAELTPYARRVIEVTATNIALRPEFKVSDVPDIEQQLSIHLSRCLQKYDCTRGKLTTFISNVLKRKAASIVRSHNSKTRQIERAAVSLEDEVTDEFGWPVERHELMPDGVDVRQQEVRLEVNDVLESIPPRLRKAAELLMCGSISSAARELGMERDDFRSGPLAELREAFVRAGFDPETFRNFPKRQSSSVKM